MTATLEELERRIEALALTRPADLRAAVTTISTHVEDTRLRMTGVEQQLDKISNGMAHLTATIVELRGTLHDRGARLERIERDHGERLSRLENDIAGLRLNMPGIMTDVLREFEHERRNLGDWWIESNA